METLICWLFCTKIMVTTHLQTPPSNKVEVVAEEPDPLSTKPQGGAYINDATNWAKEQANLSKKENTISGYVSTYTATYGGCLGCKPYWDEKGQLYYIMANGERLDDNRLTIAFYDLGIMPLGTRISLVNRTNGKSIVATITDTGGFMDCCQRVADLSLATANAIGARTDKDIVEIIPIE